MRSANASARRVACLVAAPALAFLAGCSTVSENVSALRKMCRSVGYKEPRFSKISGFLNFWLPAITLN